MSKSYYLKNFSFLVSLLLLSTAGFAEEWTCTEAASIKEGNSILVCGVATAESEGDAREQALIRAQREFQLLCEASADCFGRETNLEPLRNSCDPTDDGKFKCYRGVRYSFVDSNDGMFGQSKIVKKNGRLGPERIKMFNIGIAFANLSYTSNDRNADYSDPDNQPPPLINDVYSGLSVFFSMAFNHRYGLNFNAYRANSHDHTNESKVGADAQFIIGTHLNQSGFKAFFGIGAFSEKWTNLQIEKTFTGGEGVFGIGYNTRKATFDIAMNMRQTKPYDQHAYPSGDISGYLTAAASMLIRYGIRF
ncbi:MAG: hypothetical protein OEZ58_09460 [Gammaproteobacteria bacterium]|nr:hypothetical protein [Gammaproteobacteria bacterium]MDH5729205.1 hypothetical protein [Gammaproteobacteria bacterium]